MQLGVRELPAAGVTVTTAAKNSIEVVQIEAGKPHTAHLEIAPLLQAIKGDVRIVDPYYGTGTLHRLSELKQATSVKLLTQKPDRKEKSFLPKPFHDFATEHKQFEFRKHVGDDLHDRYLITDHEVIFLGHGLKDVGGRESFVIRLDQTVAADTIASLRDSFDQKWQTANPL